MYDPRETLDYAMSLPPGQGVILDFPTPLDARSFRQRAHALRGSEARAAKKLFDPITESEAWGKHPWPGIVILTIKRGGCRLWIGRTAKPKVRVGTLSEALEEEDAEALWGM